MPTYGKGLLCAEPGPMHTKYSKSLLCVEPGLVHTKYSKGLLCVEPGPMHIKYSKGLLCVYNIEFDSVPITFVLVFNQFVLKHLFYNEQKTIFRLCQVNVAVCRLKLMMSRHRTKP